MTTIVGRLLWALALLVFSSSAFAHRLDEYLQATLVFVEPRSVRLHINLTPGVEVVEQVLPHIDLDGDGVISTNEAAAYSEFLKRDLIVRLDGTDLELKSTAFEFPPNDELRSGWGIIRMEFSVALSPLTAGAHRITLENRHIPKSSVYLINAARPGSADIQITAQRRNDNQSLGEIEFSFHPPANSSRVIGIVASFAIFIGAVVIGTWFGRRRNSYGRSPREVES